MRSAGAPRGSRTTTTGETMSSFGSNTGYVDDLYQQYLADPHSVSAAWREFFAGYRGTAAPPGGRGAPVAELEPLVESDSSPAGAAATATATEAATRVRVAAEPVEEETPHAELAPIRGVAARIVENMETSLGVPTATTVRTIPVHLLEENRRLINEHQQASAGPKVSFTHIIGYALVSALERHPAMNHGYREVDGVPHRVLRHYTNLGLAIDVEKRGERSLVVPNIKDAARLDFAAFVAAYDDLVARSRRGKLALEDFEDTSVSITNPGMIGTALSVPRLMAGQGTIIGVGAIHHPPQCAGMSPEVIAELGMSKVMALTSTYDHRVTQGAESGAFLATVEQLLLGADGFYERVFRSLGVPHEPFRWSEGESGAAFESDPAARAAARQARVMDLIRAYRVRGHLMANLDPLGTPPPPHPELDLAHYGLGIWDLDRTFLAGGVAGERGRMGLRTILDILRQTYCRYVGVEYMHISDPGERAWLQEQMETTRNDEPLSIEEKLHILGQLNRAEAFERFLHSTYVGQKRFSLEGCETLIPSLDALLTDACEHGIEEAIIGMAHRGRLNVLANTIGKPLPTIFHEFEDVDPRSIQGSGDVKYHKGATGVHRGRGGKELALTLAPNPSHLESVDPVVEGMARARQEALGDAKHERVLPVLLHGDAAFAGQGVVFETLNMSQLRGYRTGGTIHIVINNQIGFTTGPEDARSSHYCTDVARSVAAPIFHVNADHPQAAVRMCRLALAYRQRFHKDVVIDLVCYRRWGHNEGDEPAFTQPLVVERIEAQRSTRKLSAERLLRRGETDPATVERMLEEFQELLDRAHRETKASLPEAPAARLRPDHEETEGIAAESIETGIGEAALERLVEGVLAVPEDFSIHPKLGKQFERRRAQAGEGRIDWGLAELLAFGSLVEAGVPVRLSGEDSGRGTFSQRHAVVVDHRTGAEWLPLQNLPEGRAPFHVFDSLLSEFGVLGFEYGYSVTRPDALVLWEAQFGDFVNGAQVIIDQYISSAEEKWGLRSPLVLLLPHGYEGQGPEHSSARFERFLQLCAEGNLRVCQPSTPAQYFHLLRRQALAPEKKPLVALTPKSLLRLPAAASAPEEFATGRFREVIDDPRRSRGTRRLLVASGRVIYDLLAAREERGRDDVAIVRLEQFYPFPRAELARIAGELPAGAEIAWVQDEPRNMGAWSFLLERFAPHLGGRSLRYVGRPWSASPASGSKGVHDSENRALLDEAFGEGA